MASAGPYASPLHLTPDRTTPVLYHSVFMGRMLFLTPNQQHQSTEGIVCMCLEDCISLQSSVAGALQPVTATAHYLAWHRCLSIMFKFVFFLQVTAELFNILSGQSDVDHPLCEVCWLQFSAFVNILQKLKIDKASNLFFIVYISLPHSSKNTSFGYLCTNLE